MVMQSKEVDDNIQITQNKMDDDDWQTTTNEVIY